MYNANHIVTTKYYTSLKAVLPDAAIFKNYVPNELSADSYILISNVQNVDLSNHCKHKYRVLVTIGIYTRAITENSGLTMQDMADAIFSLYPFPQSFLEIEDYQVYDVTKESDNELTITLDNGNVYVNRQIIFSHILNKLN